MKRKITIRREELLPTMDKIFSYVEKTTKKTISGFLNELEAQELVDAFGEKRYKLQKLRTGMIEELILEE